VILPKIAACIAALVLVMGLLTSGVSADSPRWSPTGSQLSGEPDAPSWSIAASPAHAEVMLQATQGHGLLRSADRGGSWSQVIPGLDWAWVVKFDPTVSGAAYAGSPSGFWKSTDEGKTWTAQNKGLNDLDVRAIDVSGQLIVVGTSKGVFYSQDGAQNWQGLGLSDLDISAVAIAPSSSGALIFAGADNGVSSSGYLFKSQDQTGSWSVVKSNLPVDATIAALAVGPANQSGQRTILAGSSQGLFKSDDSGTTWNAVNGLPVSDVNVIVFNPANGDQVYVGSDGDQGSGGVFRSMDRANTWSPMGFGLPSRPRVTALAVEPLAQLQVLAATWNPTNDDAALYRIADQQATTTGTAPAPSVSPNARVSATPAHSASVAASPSRARNSLPYPSLALGLAAGLLLALVLLAGRRYAREDRRSYRR
jgi:photosystem II stability/assembly factor-like uncharacterized protein